MEHSTGNGRKKGCECFDEGKQTSSASCSICESSTMLTLKDILPLNEVQLQDLLEWVDEAPVTRDKKNLARDMSDAGTL